MPKTKSSHKTKNRDGALSLDVNLKSAIETIPESDRYLIGLSGGLDSLALIYICVPYLRQFTSNIQAVHIHHGLSQNADMWADFCVSIGRSVDLEVVVERVQVAPDGNGIEAAARAARYQVFSRYLSDGGVLLLGHHLNDQAETVLMRVIKGLGPEALRGIPQQRYLAQGMIFRPWLNLSKASLEQAMYQKSLTWIEDESNQDRRFERNFIRHEVLPLLESRRPSVLQDLQNAARRSAEYVEFIRQWCAQNQSVFLSKVYAKERALDLLQLKTYSFLQQKFIVRYWFDWLGVEQPSDRNFNRILSDLVRPHSTKKAEVVWKNYCTRVFDGALFCLDASGLEDHDYEESLKLSDILDTKESRFSLRLPRGVLTISREMSQHSVGRQTAQPGQVVSPYYDIYSLSCRIPVNVTRLLVRSRSEGDKIELNPDYAQTLKKLYQSHRVLPWHRRHLPIIALELPASEENGALQLPIVATLAGFVAHAFKYQSSDEREDSGYHLLHFSYETSNGLLCSVNDFKK